MGEDEDSVCLVKTFFQTVSVLGLYQDTLSDCLVGLILGDFQSNWEG